MEGYKNLNAYKKHPLTRVNLQFFPESFQSSLRSYLKFVEKSENIEQLHENLKLAGEKLSLLDAFDECRIEVNPGEVISSAAPQFHLKSKPQVSWLPLIVNDPLSFGVNLELKNLFGSINVINFNCGVVAENKFKTFLLDYCSKIGLRNKYQIGFEIKKEFKYLDLNIDELSLGAGLYIKTLNNKHEWYLGHILRNNNIFVNNASTEIIKQGLLPNSKTHLTYTFKDNNLSGFGIPFRFASTTELAFSEKLEFLKFEHSLSKIWNVFSYYIQTKAVIAHIVALQADKIALNDRLRHVDVKGFRFIGKRAEPNDEVFSKNFEVSGDHLGSSLIGKAEALLYHKSFPYLSNIGLHPYLFASAAFVKESSNFNENLRSAFGLGLSYISGSSVIDFVYTSHAIKRNGDTAAEFQILISSR